MPSKSFAIRINKDLSKKELKDQLKKLETQINDYLEEPENFIKVYLEFLDRDAKKIDLAFKFEQLETADDITITDFVRNLFLRELERFMKENDLEI